MRQQGKFLLLSLDEFDARLVGLTPRRKTKLVHNHHTWIPDYKIFTNRGRDKHFSLLASMEREHLARDFSQIAQNLTTFPDGQIAICRNLEIVPAGIKGANLNGICGEHLGNFDTGKDKMSPEQKHTVITVNALRCAKFGLKVNTKTVVYHHWYDLNTAPRVREGKGTTKSCPGTNLFGANTVQACEQNFIPEIESALVEV